MVLFRLLQGVFGAPLVPLVAGGAARFLSARAARLGDGDWGVGVMVGPILGPTLGGWLTEYYNWRWVFFINVPVGILTIAGLMTYSERHAARRQGRASTGSASVLLALSIGALQMMLDRGENLDWFSSTEIMIEAGLAATAFYMFMVHMMTSDNPFIDPKLFTDRNFSVGLIAIFIVGIILLATMALLTPFLQQILDYPVLTAGLVMAPRGIGTMVAMMIVGRMIGKVDTRVLLILGFSLTAWAMYDMTGWTPDVSQWTIVSVEFVQGAGLGFLFVPFTTIAFATLPA